MLEIKNFVGYNKMHILVAVINCQDVLLVWLSSLPHVCVCFFHACNSHLFKEKETPAEAAARECAEETMGVLGTKDHLLQSLREYEENNVFKVSTVADGHRDER